MSDTIENRDSQGVATKGKVLVFVRGSDESRTLTFGRPKGISTAELLENDLAIDGDDVMVAIGVDREEGCYTAAGFGAFSSLGAALLAVEKWLTQFLGERGYEVEFR